MPAAPTAVIAGTNFGLKIHEQALRRAGYEVVGLVGRDLAKTRERAAGAGIAHGFADIGDAMKLKPTIVAVATSPETHYEIASQALAGGAHVLCEKPFTFDIAQADALQAQAAKAGLIGLLAHEFRYVEAVALFGRLLDEGAIGTPRMATFVAHGPLVADTTTVKPEWWFDRARGGGWLGASGSHAIDRIRDWYGEVAGVSVNLYCVADRPAESAEDSFDIRFTTRSGVSGTLQSTAASWGTPLTVTKAVGSQGSVWIDDPTPFGLVEAVKGEVRVGDRDGVRTIPVPDDIKLDVTGLEPQFHINVPTFTRLFSDMTAMIEGKGLSGRRPRAATFADGCANMRVLEAMRASAAQGGAWVTLP